MAQSTSTSTSGGIGFFGLLTIVLIVLKLLGKISISWWWIWSPLLVPTAFALIVMAVVAVFFVIAAILEKPKSSRRRF
jgi:hypothetical protein